MLRAFGAYLGQRDPDILTGWNFVDFDMPYITGRMEKLGLSPVMLARLPGMTDRNALRGRALFDLLTGYKKMHSSLKESYRLDAIAWEEVGERKITVSPAQFPISGKNNPHSLSNTTIKMSNSALPLIRKTTLSGFTGKSPVMSAAPWIRR